MRLVSLEANLQEMERGREAYWLRYPATSPLKLHWRAVAVRHCFHVLPGETVLELGAGTGLWTQHLTEVLRGENPITAAVFNDSYAKELEGKGLPNVRTERVHSLAELPMSSFDYVVGTAILCHDLYAHNLRALQRILKPGGQILFFEANHWNPQVFIKNVIPLIGRWAGQSRCQAPMRKYRLLKTASEQGYTNVEIVPFDIIHPRIPRVLIGALQAASYIVEHAPVIRELCGTLYIWARKPGGSENRPAINLANRPELFGAVSVVVPCHNEEMNIPLLVRQLLQFYNSYIREIIIVDDNSSDKTAEVTLQLAREEPRVKLVSRKPPNGVGRALRDGYAAATGAYILTMDSDFVQILPEFRDLFEAVANGKDGAMGSRFSYESMLINYPFAKIVANRAFHALVNVASPVRARDLSNNLKLYRAEILKNLVIEQPHFAANAETGLKPLLAGYNVEEVPISWINRSIDMGSSTFQVAKVAPGYFSALLSMVWRNRRVVRTVPKRERTVKSGS
ncbi:MAG: glycosyltransferase [Acidobacteriota bacterium]|nr:glycosyltransferase [Acidobacteriota bacterium]